MPREEEDNQKHRGFGFVEFQDAEDCEHAVDNMNDAELFGRTIKVQIAKKMSGPRNKPVWDDAGYMEKHGIATN